MKYHVLSSLTAVLLAVSVAGAAPAKKSKIDWKPCQKEIQEFCTSSTDDSEKHECLEEAPKGKVSKACKDHNEKLEAELGHKHEEGHSH